MRVLASSPRAEVRDGAKALEIAAKDPNSDGLLVVLTPQDMTEPTRTAEALRPYAKVHKKPVLASWMGGPNVAGGEAVESLLLTCGEYMAYWDGKYSQTGDDVASGIYLYRLEVDGKVLVKKMIVRK